MRHQIALFLTTLFLLVSLSACSWLTAYKLDIRQGNHQTAERVARIKPGMTKDQVRFILGGPLLTDIFHENRWDYVYRFRRGNQSQDEEIRYTVTVFFDGDGLVSQVDVPTELPKEPEMISFELLPPAGAKEKKSTASEETTAADSAKTIPPTPSPTVTESRSTVEPSS